MASAVHFSTFLAVSNQCLPFCVSLVFKSFCLQQKTFYRAYTGWFSARGVCVNRTEQNRTTFIVKETIQVMWHANDWKTKLDSVCVYVCVCVSLFGCNSSIYDPIWEKFGDIVNEYIPDMQTPKNCQSMHFFGIIIFIVFDEFTIKCV